MTKAIPKRMRTGLALLGVLAIVATSCGGGSADTAVETASPAEAATAPATESVPATAAVPASTIVANTVSGGQIDFGALAGQDVVLWFWAPW